MRYILTTALLFFLNTWSVCAQTDRSGSFIGLSAGVSLPSGSFSSTSSEDEGAGYARPGFALAFSAGSLVRDWFGIAGTIGYINHPVDEAALADNYLATHPGYDYQVHSEPYSMLHMVVGPCVSVPQGAFDIGVRGLIGLSVCTLPMSSYSSYSGIAGDPFYLVESLMDRANALVYGGGLNLMFRARGSLGLQVDAFYLHALPRFNAVEIRVYEYGQLVGLAGVDIEQAFSVFGLSGGVVFTF